MNFKYYPSKQFSYITTVITDYFAEYLSWEIMPIKSSDTVDEKKLVSQYSTPFEIQVYFYSKTLDIN